MVGPRDSAHLEDNNEKASARAMTVSTKQLIEQVRSVDVVLGFDKARNGAMVLFYGRAMLEELRKTGKRHRLTFFRFEYDSSVIRKQGEPITQEELTRLRLRPTRHTLASGQ